MKDFFWALGIAFVIFLPILTYLTHLVWWINLAMNNQLDTIGEGILAVLGTLVPPIGMLHGLIVWF